MEIVAGGQHPKSRPWKDNGNGPRTVDEAVALARQWGVVIPTDVAVVVDEWGLIEEAEIDARYFRWRGLPTDVIQWSAFFRPDGKIPILVKPSVLASDEAIVAVLAHEMHELNALRDLFDASHGAMTAQRLSDLIAVGKPGNLHDRAWDVADELVAKMRVAP